MSYQAESSDTEHNYHSNNNRDGNRIQGMVSLGQLIWTVVIGAGVFFTTLWTTQSVSATRITQLEQEMVSLHKADEKIESTLAQADSNNRGLLLDISTRLREIELKMTELQTRITFAIERQQQDKKTN
jgi:galactitol-specific phosphotransferase system IIC component